MFNVWLGYTRIVCLDVCVCVWWFYLFVGFQALVQREKTHHIHTYLECAGKRMKTNNKSEHEKLANGEFVRVLLTGF